MNEVIRRLHAIFIIVKNWNTETNGACANPWRIIFSHFELGNDSFRDWFPNRCAARTIESPRSVDCYNSVDNNLIAILFTVLCSFCFLFVYRDYILFVGAVTAACSWSTRFVHSRIHMWQYISVMQSRVNPLRVKTSRWKRNDED